MEPKVNKFPLWNEALQRLRDEQTTFGASKPTEWFEEILQAGRDTNEFKFSMLELKMSLELEDGYYLEQTHNGAFWRIPTALEHEDICRMFERKMRSYAGRSVTLRNRVLNNDKAELNSHDRARMEKSAEIAAMRRLMLRKERKAIELIKSNAPKLLSDN